MIVLILTSYPVYLILIFESSREWWLSVRRQIVKVNHSITDSVKSTPVGSAYNGIRICLLAVWFLLASDLRDVVEQIIWFSLGLWWLIWDRLIGHELMSREEIAREDTTGFGQLVPLVLLMLPFMTLIEAIHGKTLARRRYWLPSRSRLTCTTLQTRPGRQPAHGGKTPKARLL